MSYVIEVPDNARVRPAKPMLRYPGAKNRLAPWIISFFPEHDTYVEPFAGSAGVLLQKKPAKLEILNDSWKRLTNFLLVLRDRKDELIDKLEQTPFSRVFFEDTREPSDDPLDDAIRFFYHSWCKISNNPIDDKSGMKSAKHAKSNYGLPHHGYFKAIDNLHDVQSRLLDVVIENRDVFELLKKHDVKPSLKKGIKPTLFYLDPPYVLDTRTSDMRYGGETSDDSNEWHRDLGEKLNQLKGYAILSGYLCELYKELYEDNGWMLVTKKEMVNNSGKARVEGLWINPLAWKKLQLHRQLEMNI